MPCTDSSKKHRNMTSKFVSKLISHFVANDPEISVSNVIGEVQVKLQTGYTYKRAWYAQKFVIERVFGSWETTFSVLPKYLHVMKDSNPGTVYEFLNPRTSSRPDYVFKFLLWCFLPYINGFQHCRPVISVDGTHLWGPYKGILLITSTWDTNNHVFPLYLQSLIKNHSKVGIGSSNFYDNMLSKIDMPERKLSSENLTIDLEKWKLLHDGGHRHGMMTTNISEVLNSVLKKCRVIPLKALIFNKLIKYFNQHREEAKNCVHPFLTRVFDKFFRIELKSRYHTVTTYNPREVCRDNGTRPDVYVQIYIRRKLTEEHSNPIFIRLGTRTFGEMLLTI
ncbi:hypothetical protein M9H77_02591 [Catharanthus roseus]|uniref:Uncharacterized protein n=1 Tax=Catharanthus roseus TaxID=4058 RepID=A0ACC0C8U2_CATRO|nr:hypothetical protein M9H77_02591 [Catharanthus roseus]